MARTELDDVVFWDKVAEVYDTHGCPRDLIKIRLREGGVPFTDEAFDALLDYTVARRNRRNIKLPYDEFVKTLLIRLPEDISAVGIESCTR